MRDRRHDGARSTLSELWWGLPRLSHAGNGRAVGVLSVWIAWDHLLELLWRPRLVRPGGVLRYRLGHHWGRRLTLKDGTVISRGDALLELHFDNRRLLRMAGARDWNPWQTIEQIEADLGCLADLVRSGRPAPVRALHGVTLFASPGRRFGFELHPVPHTWAWSLQRFYLIALLPIYHRDGWREFERMRRDRWPAELWMSVGHLLQISPHPSGNLPPPLTGEGLGGNLPPPLAGEPLSSGSRDFPRGQGRGGGRVGA